MGNRLTHIHQYYSLPLSSREKCRIAVQLQLHVVNPSDSRNEQTNSVEKRKCKHNIRKCVRKNKPHPSDAGTEKAHDEDRKIPVRKRALCRRKRVGLEGRPGRKSARFRCSCILLCPRNARVKFIQESFFPDKGVLHPLEHTSIWAKITLLIYKNDDRVNRECPISSIQRHGTVI